jgi:hypothetical protein
MRPAMRAAMTAAVVVVVTSSCATPEAPRIVGNEPSVVWESAPDPGPARKAAPMSTDEARSIALAHDAAHNCEITARMLRSKDKQRGWAVMQQCVLRPDYTDLETLLSPPWVNDLKEQADYGSLVGHVIAVRGGDVQNDLRLCRRARLPLFSLKAALAEPDEYKGKLVVMRGAPQSGRTVAGTRALDIAETKVMAEGGFVPVGPRTTTTTRFETQDRANNSHKPDRQEDTEHNEGIRVEVLHNVSVETGLEVLAQVSTDAPFLESGTDYVLVLRFDGIDESVDGGITSEQATATVVGYFEPENGLFARLGR